MPSLPQLPHELSERVLSGKASTVLSRDLHAPATSALYRHVRLRSDAAVRQFHRTLVAEPDLGRLVRSLEFDDRREPTAPSTRTADSWRAAVDRLTNRVYDSPDVVASLLALCPHADTLTFRRLPREAYRLNAETVPTIELPACKNLVRPRDFRASDPAGPPRPQPRPARDDRAPHLRARLPQLALAVN